MDLVRSAPHRLLAVALAGLGALSPFAAGCSGGTGLEPEKLGDIAQSVTTYGDWSQYGDGQCVTGARAFYTAKFGVTLNATGLQSTDVGSCAYLGACMYWVSPKVAPDSAKWVKHAWGTAMPKTYDLVIYPPHGTNSYGHVASVDHMEGTNPSDLTKLYVMDSNYTVSVKKSPAIHTTSVTPYGFYRLKSQVGPFCTPGWSAHLNCGDEAGLHDADASTLYKCNGVTASVVQKCANGCVKEPTGTDDRCAPAPGASDASTSADGGDADAPAAHDGGASDASGALDDAATASDAATSDGASPAAAGEAGSDLVEAAAQSGGCGVSGLRRATGGAGGGSALALLALSVTAALSRRARRGARRA